MYREWKARTMAPIKLYVHWVSAPCRNAIMTCHAAGIPTEKIFVDLFAGEHKKPEFIKINPEHTVPTIVDGDFILWESRPICAYLLDSHAPGNTLYPQDLKKRAHIQRMLSYESGFYKTVQQYVAPRIFKNEETNPEAMEAQFKHLNDTVFNGKEYALGDEMTLADICLISSCTFPEWVSYEISAEKFPNLAAWVQRMKGTEWYKTANVEYEKFKQDFHKKK